MLSLDERKLRVYLTAARAMFQELENLNFGNPAALIVALQNLSGDEGKVVKEAKAAIEANLTVDELVHNETFRLLTHITRELVELGETGKGIAYKQAVELMSAQLAELDAKEEADAVTS
jgi:hypothetical protein